MKTFTRKDICTLIFITALFTVGRTLKQLKCLKTDDWIKMGYIYTEEYYLAMRKHEILPIVTRIDPERMMPSKIRQSRKPHDFTYMQTIKTKTIKKQDKQ